MSEAIRRNINVAGLAAAALLVAVMLTGCAGLPSGMQPPAITLAEIGVGNAGILEQQYNLRLRIQNPNPEEYTVDGIAFDLEINGQAFAKGVGNQTVTVPRYGSAFMQAEAVSTLSGLLKQFGRLTDGSKPVFKYRIKGVLSIAGGGRAPFEQTGEFDFSALVPKT